MGRGGCQAICWCLMRWVCFLKMFRKLSPKRLCRVFRKTRTSPIWQVIPLETTFQELKEETCRPVRTGSQENPLLWRL